MEDLNMKWEQLKKSIMGAALVLTLLPGSGLFFATTTQAATPGRGAYDRRDEERKGYRDGLDRGEEDARDHKRFDPNNSEHYREGNRFYKDGFRRGYAQGYRAHSRRRR
jgi:hypothetical protein